MSFREDGAAAVGWVADYLERVRDLPVLAQVEPGELRGRLPASPPEQAEPFAAVLRDLDDVLMPALTHWQSPRFFAYFANTASEPGILAELLARRPEPDRHPLAYVARAAGARRGDARLAEAAARPARRPPRPHRGHRLDRHDGLARRRAAREARRPGRRLLRARALVGREGVSPARARGADDPGRRRVPVQAGRARPRRRLCRRRHRRDDLDELGRPGRGDRRRV